MKKYIEAWNTAIKAETREGEYGTAHICINDLYANEENERQKETINELIFDILYRQVLREQAELSMECERL